MKNFDIQEYGRKLGYQRVDEIPLKNIRGIRIGDKAFSGTVIMIDAIKSAIFVGRYVN